VQRIEHVAPHLHPRFYCSQRFTLNLTRAQMRRVGYSPSVRLFEAAACGCPLISDEWPGLSEIFEVNRELLIGKSTEEVLDILTDLPDHERLQIGLRARRRVLREHTADHRARQLEGYLAQLGF
jgi:spore maturation protein CgeB